jgi:uncharacterized protein (DUF433 family)
MNRDRVAAALEKAERYEHRRRILNAGWPVRVEVQHGVMSGEPTITGTRILARTIASYIRAGYSEAEIRADYPSLPVNGIAAVRRWMTGQMR